MMYQRLCNKSNTTGTRYNAGTTYPSGAPEVTPIYSGYRVARSLIICVVFCRTLFVLFSFGHCVVCPFTFCSFWLPNWYLQTLILTIFQLYRCGQFDRWSKQKYQEKNIESTRNTDLLQAIDNHRPTPSHYWQTLAYNDIKDTSPWMGIELTTLSVIGTDCIGRYVHVPYDHRHKSPRYVKFCCVCLFA